MTRLELAVEVLIDVDRIFEHLEAFDVEHVAARITALIEALQILTHSPLIGRKTKGGKRELVIGQGARGYVALYRYVADIDCVFMLAIRGQRESGFKRKR